MNKKLLASGVVVALLAGGGCVNRAAQEQAKRTEAVLKDPVQPVRVEQVKLDTITETLEITGNLVTADDVQVAAKQPGRLTAVYVQDGDPVSSGQLIASQETSDAVARVEQARAQVSAARAALSQAVSNAQIAPARSAAAVKGAEAQLRQARAQLSKLQAGARPEERRQAEAALASAQAAMESARAERDRALRLWKEGASSERRYEQAEAAFRAAESQYESARQQLLMMESWYRPEDILAAQEQVRQAEENVRSAKAQQKLDVVLDQQVDAARANLSSAIAGLQMAQQALQDLRILAPLSGRISGKPSQPGTFLAPGAPVARIVGATRIYFEGEVPESQISQVRPGKIVRVRIDALGNETLTGTVAAVSPLGDQVGRLFTVRIRLEGEAAAQARPGMFARGEVQLRTLPSVTVVPAGAVVREEDRNYVYRLSGKVVKRVPVSLGLRKNGLVQVTGVEPGQRVVVQGAGQLADGMEVRLESAGTTGTGKAAATDAKDSSL